MSKVEELSEKAKEILKRYGVCSSCSYIGVREEMSNPGPNVFLRCTHINKYTHDLYKIVLGKADCAGHSKYEDHPK